MSDGEAIGSAEDQASPVDTGSSLLPDRLPPRLRRLDSLPDRPSLHRARSWDEPSSSSKVRTEAVDDSLSLPHQRPRSPNALRQIQTDLPLTESQPDEKAKRRPIRHPRQPSSGRERTDRRRIDADQHWLSEDEGTTQVESYMRDHQRRLDRGDLGSSSNTDARRRRRDGDQDGSSAIGPTPTSQEKSKLDATELERLGASDIVEIERDADIISGNNPLTLSGAERAGVIHHQHATGITKVDLVAPDKPVTFEDLPATADLTSVLQKRLTCTICVQPLIQPTSLDCGHAVCLTCFQVDVPTSPQLSIRRCVLQNAADICFELMDMCSQSTSSSDSQKSSSLLSASKRFFRKRSDSGQSAESSTSNEPISSICKHTDCLGNNRKAPQEAATTERHAQQIDVTLTKIIALLSLYTAPKRVASPLGLFPDTAALGEEKAVSPTSQSESSQSETADEPLDNDVLKRNHKSKAKKALKRMRLDGVETPEESVETGGPAEDTKELATAVLSELECQVCVSLITDPVTTRCGHSFCRKCMARSLDHSDKCPLCRSNLPNFAHFLTQAANKTIADILQHGFVSIHADRLAQIAHEEALLALDMPIFVCTLAFPQTPTFLHVFEPRYRLMIRRAMDRDRRFGMVLPDQVTGGMHPYGTVLEIKHLELLPGGRSMIETVGVSRFKLVQTGTLDGYTVAKVEDVVDLSPEEEKEAEANALATYRDAVAEREARIAKGEPPGPEIQQELSTAELMAKCHDFLNMLRTGAAPWLRQKLNDTLGPLPEDPAEFSFYVAAILPIYEYEKAKLLPVCLRNPSH